jgi:hypothetical protein
MIEMGKDNEIKEFGKEYVARADLPWHQKIFGKGKEEPLPPIPKIAEGEIGELRRLVLNNRTEHDEERAAIFNSLNGIKAIIDMMQTVQTAVPGESKIEPVIEKRIIRTSNNNLFDDGVVLRVPEQYFEVEAKDLQHIIDTARSIGIVIASAGFKLKE